MQRVIIVTELFNIGANDFDARKMLDATRCSSTPCEQGPVSFSLMFFMVDQKGVKVYLHFF